MRPNFSLGAFFALLIAITFSQAHAELLGKPKPAKPRGVTWTLVEQEVMGQPGETTIVHLMGEIPEGWHTYSMLKYKSGPQSTVVTAEPKDSVSIDEPQVSYEPKPFNDKRSADAFEIPLVEAFEQKVTIAIPLKIAAGVTGDSIKVTLKVLSTICDKDTCLPQTTTQLEPVVLLKKKVGEPEKTLTFKHTTSRELDLALADQSATITGAAGSKVFLDVEVMIKNGWHTFDTKQDPKLKYTPSTKFSIEPAETLSIEGDITTDRTPMIVPDETQGGISARLFEDKVRFKIPVRINSKVPCGQIAVKLHVATQACKTQCMPVNRSFESAIVVEGTLNKSGECAAAAPNGIDVSQGLLAFLLSAAVAGAISLLTPCVFPMIPITVSFFTKRNHVSHTRAVRDALIFSSGIIFTYVGLAFCLELVFGKNIRELATSPWMNLAIFGVFVALALSLFGFFELQLPSGLINRLNKSAHGGDSIFGLLLMGLVFTLTSFSCTGPFVGTVMLYAVNGDWVWPLLGMTVFASVFAAPFFFLALFPTALKSLPKSGGWLNSVKVVMGFVEIAAALKFLSSADLVWHLEIVTHERFVIAWILLSVAAAAYVLGIYKFPHDTPVKKRGALRYVVATAFVVVAGLLVADLAGYTGAVGEFADTFLPPRPYPPSVTDDWESGIAAAKKAGKPVFFDFTGLTCVNCRLMEGGMFKRREVEELLKNYVVVRLYTDAANTEEEKMRSKRNSLEQKNRFQKETLPFYAIVNPDGQVLDTFPEGLTDDVIKFTQFLKRGLPGQATTQATAQATAQN